MKVIDVRYLVVLAAVAGLAACDKKPAAPAADIAADTAATAVTAAAPGKQDWTQLSAATPDGGFRLGNPDAKVKLVEYASLTCPHCKDFHEEAAATIRSKYVATGNVSYEYRNFVLNGPDYAATLLARCQGAPQFFNLINAFYDAQGQWVQPFANLSEADAKRLGALPENQQIGALAKFGGLDTFMRARGMTATKFEECVSDAAAIKRLAEIRDKAGADGVAGTPTFFINGVKQENTTIWSQLEPKLQAALL